MKSCLLTAALLLALSASPVSAQIGSAIGAGPDLNLISFGFVDLPSGLATAAGNANAIEFTASTDLFGIVSRDNVVTPPANMLDDSVADEGDTIGIIKSDDLDDFFGVIDTVNPDNDGDPIEDGAQSVPLIAEWVFDISSSSSGSLSLEIDFAAMGDFESGVYDPLDPLASSPDIFVFEAKIDDGDFETVFEGFVDNDGPSIDYTFEDGSVASLADSLSVNGVELNNEFQTLSQSVDAGDTLTLRFTNLSDGGSEPFAFRNIVVESDTPFLASDFNMDGVVDVLDLDILGTNFNMPGDRSMGDANLDGNVDILDLDILGPVFKYPSSRLFGARIAPFLLAPD